MINLVLAKNSHKPELRQHTMSTPQNRMRTMDPDLDSEEYNACQFVTISLLLCQVRNYLLNGEGGEVLHDEFGILSVQQHLVQPAPRHFKH